jgi:ABC-type transport system involved in cytochrome bd biosynthesis fused ATPase/permease subunit
VKVRFAGLPRFLWWIATPISLLVVINYGWLSAVILLVGYVLISIVATAVSAAVFPMNAKRYESDVTGINLRK